MFGKIVFDINALNLLSIAPMTLLVCFGLFILCVGMIKDDVSNKFYVTITALALVLNSALVAGYSGALRGFFGLILMDGITVLAMILIALVSLVFILFLLDDEQKYEYYTLFLFMVAGYQFMVSSDNLILIIVALELSSLILYTLIAMRNTKFAVEAAIKYFVMGALATGFLIFGAGLLYLASGSVEIYKIALTLNEIKGTSLLNAAAVFLVVAFGFKISLVPFHTWLADVYEGSTAPLAGFISIVPKLAVFVAMLRLFSILLGTEFLDAALYILVVVTMTVANVAALVQRDVKRMLAFSSISHSGFILAAIFINSTSGTVSLFIYWVMFAFANLGAFGMLWALGEKSKCKRYEYPFERFKGLAKSNLTLALAMGLFMFSLAGIPPFSVFWGKLGVLSSAISSGYVVLAVVMAINSAIAVYYYLKVVVYMFLYEGENELVEVSLSYKWILGVCFTLCLLAPFVLKFIYGRVYDMVIFSGF